MVQSFSLTFNVHNIEKEMKKILIATIICLIYDLISFTRGVDSMYPYIGILFILVFFIYSVMVYSLNYFLLKNKYYLLNIFLFSPLVLYVFLHIIVIVVVVLSYILGGSY